MTLTNEEFEFVLRNDLSSFIERIFLELNPHTGYLSSPYIDLLASKLEDCRNGKTTRLIINFPPRCLKSHAVTVAFVAWLLGHKPSTKIIAASYGQDLADKHGRDCRTAVVSPVYKRLFPATVLSGE